MFWFGFAMGAIIASAGWWIKVRSLSGVISDIGDAKNSAPKL